MDRKIEIIISRVEFVIPFLGSSLSSIFLFFFCACVCVKGAALPLLAVRLYGSR